MRVELNQLRGARLHPAGVHTDQRGNFVKLHDADEGAVVVDQVCTSFNHRAGTLRGLHIQLPPHAERKFVWCTAGAVWDVLVDARRGEATYGAWAAIELRADQPRLLEVPPGIAHGYQTLTDDAAVAYLIDGQFVPAAARTIAWNDHVLAIEWPADVTEMSVADRAGSPWPAC